MPINTLLIIRTSAKKSVYKQQDQNIGRRKRLIMNSLLLVSRFKSVLSILSIVFLGLTISMPAFANTADWGLVQRFNEQNKLAEQGNVKAMYDVGKLYQRGRGVNKDITKAAEWFQNASTGGYAAAQARLGILYFEGRGVKQSYKKALKLLNSAANKNIPSAQYQLANMYELGTGVKQNLSKSIAWYKKADQYGYYLAKAKVTRLEKLLKSGGSIKRKATPQSVTKAKKAPSPLIQTILNGRWLKRKSAVGYLPSIISNCTKDSYNSMHCISTSQERSTGTEIITYNTESVISTKNKKSFNIIYTNNVLEVALLAAVDGDGESIDKAPSRIKKGKQGKQRTLKCSLKDNKTIECRKGTSIFNLISQ